MLAVVAGWFSCIPKLKTMSQNPLLHPKVPTMAAIILALVYLLNPFAGVVELIPDNIPVVGNLDEMGVTVLMLRWIDKLRKYNKKEK